MPFLIARYGRLAALAFTLAILIRLYNEVWSNTAVVGAYYGKAGEWTFIAAALLFTAATLVYALKGGLRSSIVTDVIQTDTVRRRARRRAVPGACRTTVWARCSPLAISG